jgi:Protein of unknown function (DUF3455)
MMQRLLRSATLTGLLLSGTAHAQNLPEAIQAPGEKVILTLYAEGAQVYECKVDQADKLAWTFR